MRLIKEKLKKLLDAIALGLAFTVATSVLAFILASACLLFFYVFSQALVMFPITTGLIVTMFFIYTVIIYLQPEWLQRLQKKVRTKLS